SGLIFGSSESDNKILNALVKSSDTKSKAQEIEALKQYLPIKDLQKLVMDYLSDEWNEYQTIQGHEYSVNAVSFSLNGKYLASGSTDKTIKIWELKNNKFELIQTLQGHGDWVNSVTFSPNGKYLASGSPDKTIKIWELKNNKFELITSV